MAGQGEINGGDGNGVNIVSNAISIITPAAESGEPPSCLRHVFVLLLFGFLFFPPPPSSPSPSPRFVLFRVSSYLVKTVFTCEFFLLQTYYVRQQRGA